MVPPGAVSGAHAMSETSVRAIRRLLEYVRSAPYPDLTPAFTLSCAADIQVARNTALASLELLLEREMSKHNPNRSAELVKRVTLFRNAVNPTASKWIHQWIHPITLDDAVGLGLLTDEEHGVLISMQDWQPAFRREDDILPILQRLESEVETLECVVRRCSHPSESHQRKPKLLLVPSESPNFDIDQAQVRLALEKRFKGTFECEIKGTAGRIYVFRNPPNTTPERVAVKTVDPARVTGAKSISAIKQFAHEVKHWIAYRHSPFIIAPFFTEFVHGWPYIAMAYCECTLREYIDGKVPKKGLTEALALMVQIICGLEYAHERGLKAHQDLKPENVLLWDSRKRFALPEDDPLPWCAKLADFGLANGYLELNIRYGSRPYWAPEQYDANGDLSQVDIFACGVMFHELLTGRHPIGEVISEVWPEPKPGKQKKWEHEKIWKKWARSDDKLISAASDALGPVRDLVVACLSTKPGQRPSLDSFKQSILHALKQIDPHAYEALLMLLVYYECMAIHSETVAGTDTARYQQEHIDLLTR